MGGKKKKRDAPLLCCFLPLSFFCSSFFDDRTTIMDGCDKNDTSAVQKKKNIAKASFFVRIKREPKDAKLSKRENARFAKRKRRLSRSKRREQRFIPSTFFELWRYVLLLPRFYTLFYSTTFYAQEEKAEEFLRAA